MSIVTQNSTITNEVYTEEEINGHIHGAKNFITMMEMSLASSPPESEIPTLQAELKKYQDDLALWEARKAALTQ